MTDPRPEPAPTDAATLIADLRALRQRLQAANDRLLEAAGRAAPPPPRA
ncbi:hypothetical protein [Longimicrobium sp.]|nr:hypothetical protein [Longimicrobium sp.]HEX6039831.1 hypothetical protein [Longimicrobium sp.]